jgi:hypothetical protein
MVVLELSCKPVARDREEMLVMKFIKQKGALLFSLSDKFDLAFLKASSIVAVMRT